MALEHNILGNRHQENCCADKAPGKERITLATSSHTGIRIISLGEAEIVCQLM